MGRGGKRIYHVRLDDGGRTLLQRTVDGGKGSVTRRRRAHILLLADANRDGGGRDDSDIADVPEAGASTVERARKRFGLDGGGQAMLACSEPPKGPARRSLRLPGDRLVELEVAESIPEGTVRQGLSYETLQVKCPFSKPHIGVPPSVGGRLPCHRGSPDRTSRFHDALNDASSLLSGSVGRCRPRDHYARFGRCDVPGGAGPI